MGSSLACPHHGRRKGEEAGLFDRLTGGGDNNAEAVEVAEINSNNMSESTEMEDSDENVPTEIAQLLESCTASGSVAMNNSNATLICNILPGMVDNDRIPSTTPGADPPRDAKDSGSARSHSTHLETSSSNRP